MALTKVRGGGVDNPLTLGGGSASDNSIIFDGNAQDFHIGLDDSTDKLTIGKGTALGTTTSITFDANGQILKPLQTYFRVRKSGHQENFATGTNVVVTWETEDFDVGGNFASNTFTAPVTGIYLFHLTLRLDNLETASGYYSASINTSNREYRWIEHFPTISDKSYFTVHVTAIIDMDASDTADARIYQHSSTAQTDIKDDQTRTLFQGYLLG
tara:strand:- start:113 stop:751 length:639 start_codon:yes stop_codon:yes gene_type:complete